MEEPGNKRVRHDVLSNAMFSYEQARSRIISFTTALLLNEVQSFSLQRHTALLRRQCEWKIEWCRINLHALFAGRVPLGG